MRVAIDATPLIGSRTGIGVFVEELLRSFRDYIPDDAGYEVAQYTLSLKAGIAGSAHGHWVPLPARASSYLWRTFGGPKIERFVGNVDVVHGTNFVVPPSNVPRVISVHDLSFLNEARSFRNSNRRFDHSVREAVNSGATVHTISEYVAEEIRDRYGAQDVHVVYPGVEQKTIVPKTVQERPTLLAVGATHKRKGLVDLIKAFHLVARQNENVQLQLVGPAGNDEENLDQSIKKLPIKIRNRVHRLGYVSREHRDQLIGNATILVHPSHYEGFGFPVLEAVHGHASYHHNRWSSTRNRWRSGLEDSPGRCGSISRRNYRDANERGAAKEFRNGWHRSRTKIHLAADGQENVQSLCFSPLTRNVPQ